MTTLRTTGRPSDLRAFKPFLFGQAAAFLAYQMLVVAVGWQVYDLTRSPFMLGMAGLVQFLPQFLLTLVAGHVADRYDRRRIVIACLAVECATAAVLALGSFGNWLTVELVLVCACVLGAARAFESPTTQALLPTLVESALLPRCLALSASGRQLAVIAGPSLGGLLYIAGADAVYGASCLAYGAASILFLCIRSDAPPLRRQPVTMQSVFEGITFIWSKPDILGAISLDLFSVLLGGATALLPIYARDILFTGPWGLGLLRAAPAVGAFAMSVYLARSPLKRQVGRTMFAAVAVFGAATIVFGLSRWFALSITALAVLGASDMISVVIRSSLVQLETPDDKRGRVSAVNSMFIGTSNQLGEFESGVTAAWFGTVPAVVAGGVCTVLVVACWMRLYPGLANRQTLVPEAASPGRGTTGQN